MRLPRSLWFVLAACAGCGGDLIGNEGFEIDCDGQPCDWTVVEGEPAPTSWHDGDVGFDLSGDGRAVIEQRVAPFQLDERELVLGAAVVRRGGARLRFELDWYVAGEGEGPHRGSPGRCGFRLSEGCSLGGPTYWDREPTLIDQRGSEVDGAGVFAVEELVSTPSLEVSGLVLRVVKEGSGTAVVDEVTLARPGVLP